jgi:hypothetical protein
VGWFDAATGAKINDLSTTERVERTESIVITTHRIQLYSIAGGPASVGYYYTRRYCIIEDNGDGSRGYRGGDKCGDREYDPEIDEYNPVGLRLAGGAYNGLSGDIVLDESGNPTNPVKWTNSENARGLGESQNDGGAICLYGGGDLLVEHSSFMGNTVSEETIFLGTFPGNGGAICHYGGGHTVVKHSSFVGNEAARS